ncbi:aminopeptidase P family protein [Candidatus Roizmanbacteria bacterium]|nr:aminopeptidase P family protein [Candidatus Roizmanbacteria bacterium]
MIKKHLAYLQNLLDKNSLDAVLISSLSNIIHLTNFSHFTDLEREAYILITKKDQFIFTDARYSHAVKTQLKNFQLLEISTNNSFTKHLQKLMAEKEIKKLGVEENNITVTEHKRLTSIFKESVHIELKNFRVAKTDLEINNIKKACAIGDKTFSYILKKIKLGMTEKEIAFLLETFIRKQGAEISFPSIIAFGANAAVPHHKTGIKKLTANNFILMDFGVQYENYCSDMTRTIFFGKATKEPKKVYQVVKEAQKLAINYIQKHDSILASEVDKIARDYITKNGYDTIPHSLGHGIGLQVHEAPSLSPNSKDLLTEGMVFSIEPGIYLNDKFGVRIEDLFAIQENKLVQLTKSETNLIEI